MSHHVSPPLHRSLPTLADYARLQDGKKQDLTWFTTPTDSFKGKGNVKLTTTASTLTIIVAADVLRRYAIHKAVAGARRAGAAASSVVAGA